jgi:hypothetical protein
MVVSILDVPLAIVIVAAFFGARRFLLAAEDTMVTEYECSIGSGMYRVWMCDGDHSTLRQATTLAISLFTFTLVPVAVNNLGDSAGVVIALQTSSFTVLLLGMISDYLVGLPDSALAKGEKPCCTVWPRAGCIITSHGLWHVAAFVGAALAVSAREVAFSVL